MTDLLRQAITTCDLVAHALSRDPGRTVLIGVDGEVITVLYSGAYSITDNGY